MPGGMQAQGGATQDARPEALGEPDGTNVVVDGKEWRG